MKRVKRSALYWGGILALAVAWTVSRESKHSIWASYSAEHLDPYNTGHWLGAFVVLFVLSAAIMELIRLGWNRIVTLATRHKTTADTTSSD